MRNIIHLLNNNVYMCSVNSGNVFQSSCVHQTQFIMYQLIKKLIKLAET